MDIQQQPIMIHNNQLGYMTTNWDILQPIRIHNNQLGYIITNHDTY